MLATKITNEQCLFVQTDDYAGDKFISEIVAWADQINGPVHVDINDLADLQGYCKHSNHRLQELLQEVREQAEMGGIENIIFF